MTRHKKAHAFGAVGGGGGGGVQSLLCSPLFVKRMKPPCLSALEQDTEPPFPAL